MTTVIPKEVLVEVGTLKAWLRYNSYLYHVLDAPEVSDAVYDQHYQRLQALEEQYPTLVTPESTTQVVGAVTPVSEAKTLTMTVPMLSIRTQTDHTLAGAQEFVDRVKSELGEDTPIEFVPKESNKYLGFYEIPKYSLYLINRDGTSVINKETGCIINVRVYPEKYYLVTVFSDEKNKSHTLGIHRLVCLAFHGPKPVYENDVTTVNHKDGIKTNNHYTNLEWCSGRDNTRHAWKTGLMPVPLVRLYVQNVYTLEETPHESIEACSKALCISDQTLRLRLKLGPDKVWPGIAGSAYRFRKEAQTFKEMSQEEIDESLSVYIADIRVFRLNVCTGIEEEFITMRELSRIENIDLKSLQFRLKKSTDKIWPDKHGEYYRYRTINQTFKKMSEEEINKSLKEYNHVNARTVLVKWSITGSTSKFSSINETSEVLGIPYVTIVERCNNKDQLLYISKNRLYQIQFEEPDVSWREIPTDNQSILKELKRTKFSDNIVVLSEDWKTIHAVYVNREVCSKENNLSISTLYKLYCSFGEKVYNCKRYIRAVDYLYKLGKAL